MSTILLQCCQNTAQVIKCSCEVAMKTSEQDVAMTQTICCAIVSVIAILVVGFLLWKWMEHIYQKRQTIRQNLWDAEDKNRTTEAEERNRTWHLEDENRKHADEDRKRAWQLADEDRKRARQLEDEERKRTWQLADEDRERARIIEDRKSDEK